MSAWRREEIIGDARLLLGDCREILPTLGKVDAVMTDPPYGIGFKYESYIDTRESLQNLIDSFMPECRSRSLRVCITPGQTQIDLYPSADWVAAVTWDTTGTFGACGYSQWMPVLFYGQDVTGFGRTLSGVLKSDLIRFSGGAGVGFQRELGNDHPCAKPENVISALVARFSDPSEIVLDPFMGSGTTGVACARLGRRFIGVEIHEPYFDVACRRIDAAQRQGRLFDPPKPSCHQLSLLGTLESV